MTNTTHTTGKIAAYLRVSTTYQNLARQEGLREGADRVFEEKVTGKSLDRPALRAMIDWAREGDTIRVYSVDRLARTYGHAQTIIDELNAKGATIEFVKEKWTFSPNAKVSAMDRFVFNFMSNAADFERENMLERQAEGIAKAKERGVYKGRAPKIDAEVVKRARELDALGVSKAEIGRQLSLGRTSVYKALNGDVTKAG